MTDSLAAVDVRHVSKKFCRQLKRALWYGIRDLGEVLMMSRGQHRLQRRPGEFFAVHDASFSVQSGECVSLLGPNGAGKSTMLKMLNGLIRPDGGSIRIQGRVGALIELGAGFNPILSGRENVFINGAVLGLRRREIERQFDEIVGFAELGHVIDTPVQTYSSGMRVRLGFAIAANLRPNILLIDEVLAVGDVGFRLKCLDQLQRLSRNGVAIIIVTHAVNMLTRLSNRAIVFGGGEIRFDGELSRGIAVYEQLMDVHQKDQDQETLQGLPGARIESCEVFDECGRPRVEFHCGDTIRLRTRVRVDQPIDAPRLVVSINSPSSGVVATFATSATGFRFRLDPVETSIDLQLPSLPLLTGGYFATVSVFGPGSTDFYHRRVGVARFSIVADPDARLSSPNQGIVSLPHSWSIES